MCLLPGYSCAQCHNIIVALDSTLLPPFIEENRVSSGTGLELFSASVDNIETVLTQSQGTVMEVQ